MAAGFIGVSLAFVMVAFVVRIANSRRVRRLERVGDELRVALAAMRDDLEAQEVNAYRRRPALRVIR